MTTYAAPLDYVLDEIPKTTGATQSDNFNINVLDPIRALKHLMDGTEEHGADYDFKPGAGFDFKVTLGDAAGAQKLSILDSGLVEVASIDSDGNLIASGVGTIKGLGTGGITDYDLNVGDTDGTPTYGIIRIGDAIIGRTSYNVGSINLDGAVIFRNNGGPVTSEIEFIFAESTGGTCRFALPKSGVGNATYNPRSMLLAGPAPADTDFVKVSYWQGQGIFHNLVCDTAGDGADLGVQNDLEVEGDIFTDSILESTLDAGVTIDGVLVKDSVISAANIKMAVIGTPTFTTVQHIQDVFHSAGWVSGGAVTDAGGGNVNIDAGAGLIRATDSAIAQILFFDWAQSLSNAIPADTVRYVGIEYNAGSPQIVIKTTNSFDSRTDFLLDIVINEGGTLHIQNERHAVGDHASQMILRLFDTLPKARDEQTKGITLGETGTRNVTVSPGNLWEKLEKYPIAQIDTSVSGSFDRYYRDGVGGFTREAAQTVWPNTQYDNGSGTLVTMTPNRYANLWFYVELDGELVMLYGQDQYTSSAGAEDESPPSSTPDRVTHHGRIIGRMIFQKSAGTAVEIQSVFSTVFSASQAADHGNLAGLSDDDHTQYRLESADHSHASAGLQGGQISHDTALTGVSADDHHNEAHGISVHTEHANWKAFYSDGSGDEQEIAVGAAGTILAGQGVGAAPAFDAMSGDASIAAGGVVTVAATHAGSAHHAKYLDSEAIAAVEGEATLDLTGDVSMASGKTLSLLTDGSSGGLKLGAASDVHLYRGAAGTLYLASGDGLSLVDGVLAVNTTAASAGGTITSIQDGVVGAHFTLAHDSASPAINDIPGRLVWVANDDEGNATTFGFFQLLLTNVDHSLGAEESRFQWVTRFGSANNSAMVLSGAGGLTVDADVGTADDPVGLFDDLDDMALVKGFRERMDIQPLVEAGIMERKENGRYMIHYQRAQYFTWDAMRQMHSRIQDLEAEVAALKAA